MRFKVAHMRAPLAARITYLALVAGSLGLVTATAAASNATGPSGSEQPQGQAGGESPDHAHTDTSALDDLLNQPSAATGQQTGDKGNQSPGNPVAQQPGPKSQNAPTAEASTPQSAQTIPLQAPEQASAESLTQPHKSERTSQIEEIIVTANKRAESLQNFAGSVGVVSGNELEKIGAQGMEDYVKRVPGVVLNQSDADTSLIAFRGIATSNLNSQTTPIPFGIFINDTPATDLFPQTTVPNLNPFDLQRVEVLKGPQGTLFGASALSGAIRYITNNPVLDAWQAKLMGTYTKVYDGQTKPLGAVMVNVPVGHTAAIRLVDLERAGPGYIDDNSVGRNIKDANYFSQWHRRAEGLWKPLERMTWTASYVGQRTDQANSSVADQPDKLERSNSPQPSPSQSRFEMGNVTGTYDFDWATLTALTSRIGKGYSVALVAQEQDTALPGSPGTQDQNIIGPLPVRSAFKLRGWFHELRLSSPDGGPWHWIGGLAYRTNNVLGAAIIPATSAADQASIPPLPVFPIDTPLGTIQGTRDTAVFYVTVDGKAIEKAVFGEIGRTFFDGKVDVSAGAREFENKETALEIVSGALALTSTHTEDMQHLQFREKKLNPKFSLKYTPISNITLYALAVKGFQFGGAQASVIRGSTPEEAVLNLATNAGKSNIIPYKSSILWNYEVGARTNWWDDRVRFDATVFYMNWSNLQLQQFDPIGLTSFTINVGKAHSQGAEMGLQINPFSGVTFASNAALIQAETDQDVAGTAPKGTRLPLSARFQLSNILSYEQPFSLKGEWTAGVSATHTHNGKRYNDLQQSASMPGYELFDFRAHLLRTDLSWQPDFSLSLNNAFDKRGIAGVNFTKGSMNPPGYYFVQPRTVLATLTLGFF